jgi:DNA-binding NarL/FixJ family response regulator
MSLSDTRILIADDHEVYRDGLRMTLSREQGLVICGEAQNGEELVRLAKKEQPDIILTDIKMPRVDGIQATQQITAFRPATGIIALSMFNEESLVVDMLEAGAMGYLLKSSDKSEIIDAIRMVQQGYPYYCSSTSARLAITISGIRFDSYKKRIAEPLFSAKEIEIIRLICEEYSAREIGDQLFHSMRTVEGYRRKILEKMHAKNTAGIVIYAIRHGLYRLEDPSGSLEGLK